MCTDHHRRAQPYGLDDREVVELMDVGDIRSASQGLAEPFLDGDAAVNELGTVMYAHSGDVLARGDSGCEHLHVHPMASKRGGTLFDVSRYASISTPQWRQEQHRARRCGVRAGWLPLGVLTGVHVSAHDIAHAA
jgi:hypothetical protein